eukprot:3932744-Rhodomonas_salina.2
MIAKGDVSKRSWWHDLDESHAAKQTGTERQQRRTRESTQKTNDEGRCVGKGVAGGQSERERNKGGWDALPASVEDIGCVDDECRAHALW